MNIMQRKAEAAEMLDKTHAVGERGPRTMRARDRIATALDMGITPAKADVLWLRHVYNTRDTKT